MQSHQLKIASLPKLHHYHDFFEITNRISSTYKNKTEGGNPSSVNLCPIVTNYRTFIDDLYKVLEFVEWYKEWY